MIVMQPTEADIQLEKIAAMVLRLKFDRPDLYDAWMEAHTKTFQTAFGKLTFVVCSFLPEDKFFILP